MKRLWVILAAVMMLAQWSYAAAGAYCSHEGERSAAAAHWGHHFHSHAGAEQAKDSPDSKASFHGDCAFCHAACAIGPVSFVGISLASFAAPLNAAAPPRLVSRSPDLPERPQWPVPALA